MSTEENNRETTDERNMSCIGEGIMNKKYKLKRIKCARVFSGGGW